MWGDLARECHLECPAAQHACIVWFAGPHCGWRLCHCPAQAVDKVKQLKAQVAALEGQLGGAEKAKEEVNR